MPKKPDTSLSTNHALAQSAQPSTTTQSVADIANEVSTHASSSSSGASAVSKGRFSFSPDGKTLLEVKDSDLSNGCFDIPASVTSIGGNAFWGCTGLTQVVIPAGVTSIGENAFWGCTGLTQVVIPAGVTSIGENAFWDCTGLTQVVIPAGVTSIAEMAFLGCTGLTQVVIPASVTSIHKHAFFECSPGILLYCPDDAYQQIATLLPDNLRRNLYPEFAAQNFTIY